MPKNPTRDAQGGDVEGTKKTVVTQGEPIDVAAASFDPGYSLETTLNNGSVNIDKANLMRGYCTYGNVIGESSKKG